MAKKSPPPAREPYNHTLTVEGKDLTVIVEPLDVGFNVIVPIAGGTSAVYDDSLDAALGEAQKRLETAAREFTDGARTTRADVDGAEAEIVLNGTTGSPIEALTKPSLHETIAKLRDEIENNDRLKREYSDLGKVLKDSNDELKALAKRVCDLEGDPQMSFAEALQPEAATA